MIVSKNMGRGDAIRMSRGFKESFKNVERVLRGFCIEDTMLRNELSKYKLIRYKPVQHTPSALHLCTLLSALIVLRVSVVHASSRCADLVSSPSQEQSVTDFRSGSEPASHGKNTLPPISSSGSTLGSSSGNAFEPSLTSNALESSSGNALDFYSNFFNFSNSKNPIELTKGFQSYIGELLDKRIIGDSELIRFIEHLEKGELINPISEDEARVSTPLLVQRRGLQNYLDNSSLNQKELLAWSRATLEKRARVRVKREEAREETRELPYQKLEFHLVKRPVQFDIRYVEDKTKPVTLTHPIEVQSTPVTQKQWVEIMGENPSEFTKGEDSIVLNFDGKDIELQPDNPVENMTWWSALEFANRLSKEHGLQPAYDLSRMTWRSGTRSEDGTLRPVNDWDLNSVRIYIKGKSHDPFDDGDIYYQAEGYRLPTHAEQKYMLQGGGNIKSSSRFFKNETEMKAHAWYQGNADSRTHQVGLLQPMVIDGKEFYDLYGNVEELGMDSYDLAHNLESEQNPLNLGINDIFSITSGGGWQSRTGGINSGKSLKHLIHGSSYVGFRLVRTIETGDGE